MADDNTIRQYINEALEGQKPVYIRYRDYSKKITERAITPLEWIEPDKILAFCHLRKEERNFRVQNIIEISFTYNDLRQSSFPPNQPKSTQDSTQPIVVSRSTHEYHKNQNNALSFSKVTISENWKSLLHYYIACLNYEYQQGYSFFENALEPIDLKPEKVYSFLSGKSNLEFNLGTRHSKLKSFLDPTGKRNQQLCLGKSFIRFNDQIITPLLFVPVTINRNNSENILLRSEELSLSYASLLKLGYSLEEVAEFLTTYQEFIDHQPPIQDIEKYIINTLSEDVLPSSDHLSDHEYISVIPNSTFLDITGLFWADNRFTGNLINELNELINFHDWKSVPTIIDNLFNHLPKHKHQSAPEFIDDQNFYVTDINTQQRKSSRAISEHPVTIITGPPGTGKSQLVLNLIAQAFLEAQSVLFASRNNKAVDVVMDRLQDEIRFQGAIRTGTKSNRKKAVAQMETALAQIRRFDLDDLQSRYEKGKKDLKKTDQELKLIRDLKGKIRSYQNEKEELLKKIPQNWTDEVTSLDFSFNENDKIRINKYLSAALAKFRNLIEQREKLAEQLRVGINGKEVNYPALKALKEYELKWGEFASGILHKTSFSSLSELHAYCSNLLNILHSLSIKKQFEGELRILHDLKKQIDQYTEKMTDEQVEVTLKFSVLSTEDLKNKLDQLVELKNEIKAINTNDYPFIKKILIALHIINPKKKFIQNLNSKLEEAGLRDLSIPVNTQDADNLNQSYETFKLVIQTSELIQKMENHEEKEAKLKSQLDKLCQKIPSDTVKSFEKVNLEQFTLSPADEYLREIQQNAASYENELYKALKNCMGFFIYNDENIQAIHSFNKLNEDKDVKGPFGLRKDLTEGQAFDWATTFRRALVIWEANTIISFSDAQLADLPTEEQSLAAYKIANDTLFMTAGNLMRATWFDRAEEVSNEVYKGTRQYISAVDQLNNLNYGQDAHLYGALKESERKNFTYAFQMFPVWAITNLTARTNFPLDSGLFDLLIIDEASQCDIPSAIPMLFRAKKVVIIGDPNQLRHVASLNDNLDKSIGKKYHVGLEAFSYISTSLYDLGERSVGLHPGPILLNEHYRSDLRIIDFSNKEFYGNKLIIKTDLTQRGYEKTFLNQYGGIHWINVKGNYERPRSGRSAFNSKELEQLEILVPKILNFLDDNDYKKASLGIVTPFRAQENRINDWLGRTYGTNERIKSGTAHQFQGDECDVIIFSPVLSSGISKGTLNWLETTYNLLNVAITRARVILIVIGDFDYCFQELKTQSVYSHLAKYVKNQLNGVYNSIDELPIFGGGHFEILGTILDPSNPEYNRTNLLRFIRSCKEYVDWFDPYLTHKLLNQLNDLYDKEPYPDIKNYRLLTAERQVKISSAKLRPESIESLKLYLEKFNVDFEMRVLPGEALPHDRFLYHLGGAVNMPPFSGAYGSHHHVSEYTASNTNRDLFEQYWEKAISVVDVY